MIKSKSKTGMILVLIYLLAAASILLTSFRCDWNSGNVCDQGLQTASYPASMVVSVIVYPLLKMVGHLDAAIKSHGVLYDIFYPSVLLNILIYYGLGVLINEFLYPDSSARTGKEYRHLLGDKEIEKDNLVKLLALIGCIALFLIFIAFLLK
jgi:hypothetical protein